MGSSWSIFSLISLVISFLNYSLHFFDPLILIFCCIWIYCFRFWCWFWFHFLQLGLGHYYGNRANSPALELNLMSICQFMMFSSFFNLHEYHSHIAICDTYGWVWAGRFKFLITCETIFLLASLTMPHAYICTTLMQSCTKCRVIQLISNTNIKWINFAMIIFHGHGCVLSFFREQLKLLSLWYGLDYWLSLIDSYSTT